MFGEYNGQEGIFPANFVQLVRTYGSDHLKNPDISGSVAKSSSGGILNGITHGFAKKPENDAIDDLLRRWTKLYSDSPATATLDDVDGGAMLIEVDTPIDS